MRNDSVNVNVSPKTRCGAMRRSRTLVLCAALGVSQMCFGDSPAAHGQTATPSPQTLPAGGERIEREIESGQTHSYTIEVSGGDFVEIHVDQLGVDVAIDVLDPAGKKLFTADSPTGPSGIESATFVSAGGGRHTLDVKVFECTSNPRGKYTIGMKTPRAATDRDRTVAEATRIEADALAEWNKFTDEGSLAALEKYAQAQKLWNTLGETAREADILSNVGAIHLGLGELQKGFDAWGAELKLRRQINDKVKEAVVLNNQGQLLLDSGDAKQAMTFFEKALPLGEADSSVHGSSLRRLAQAYSNLGNKKKATEAVGRAIGILEKSDDRVEEAKAHDLAGNLNRERGRQTEALSHLRKALAVWETNCEEAASYSTTLSNIGHIHTDTGNRETALEYYQLAVEKSREAGDPDAEFVALNGLGVLYEKLGQKDASLLTLTEALALAREGNNQRELGFVLLNLGRAHQPFRNLSGPQARADARRAISYYNRSIAAFRLAGDEFRQADGIINVALVQQQFFSPALAGKPARRALAMAERLGHVQVQGPALILLGRLALGNRQWRAAGKYFEKALSVSKASGLRGIDEVEAYYGRARALLGQGDLLGARQNIESALAIVEDNRSRITDRDLRTSYFGSIQDYYEFYVDLLMRMHRSNASAGHDRAAAEVSERSRSRSLVDFLHASDARVKEGIDPDALNRREMLLREIDGKLSALTTAMTGEAATEDVALIRAELEQKTEELKTLDESTRSSNPRYTDLVTPDPVSVEALQADLLDPDSVLIEYFLGKQKSYVWTVTTDRIESRELPGKAVIEQLAADFHTSSSTLARRQGEKNAGRSDRTARLTANERASLRLSRMVLGPVAGALSKKRLVIAGHGALQYIPFAALPDPRPGMSKPLVEDHEIVSIPSASAVLADKKNAHRRTETTGELIVFADPIFSKDDARLTAVKPAPEGGGDDASRKVVLDDGVEQAAQDTGVLKPGLRLKRLPGTRREADEIRKTVSREGGRGLYDFDANRDIAMSGALSNYRVVHFATHGLLNAKNPENSGLVLSRFDEKGAPRDGFLRARDVLNMRLNADLVVLSACETGLGQDVRGEGLVGLSRAFLYAGAPRIVVSLWAVNDAATAELMTRFYRKYYTEKMAPAAALRAAQIELIQETEWKEPCYWAAFVLQGAWE